MAEECGRNLRGILVVTEGFQGVVSTGATGAVQRGQNFRTTLMGPTRMVLKSFLFLGVPGYPGADECKRDTFQQCKPFRCGREIVPGTARISKRFVRRQAQGTKIPTWDTQNRGPVLPPGMTRRKIGGGYTRAVNNNLLTILLGPICQCIYCFGAIITRRGRFE